MGDNDKRARRVASVFLAANGQQGGSAFSAVIMMVLVFAAIYFLMIRPQQRRRRQVEAMQSTMGIGDQVVTIGGLHGTIHSIDDETVQLTIAPGVVVSYARGAVSKVLVSAADAEDVAESDIDEARSDAEGSSGGGYDTDTDTAGGKTPDQPGTGAKRVVKRDHPR